MKITIDTEILKKYDITLPEFLVLLTGYYNLDCEQIYGQLIDKELAERNLFKGFPPILSNNVKDLIAKILVESDPKAIQSGIDFEKLAEKLQSLYPEGNKPGTTYLWRGTTDVIAQKLRALVVVYDFVFTEDEAIAATKEHLESPSPRLLRNFILTTKKDKDGRLDMSSIFMTIIENNRET